MNATGSENELERLYTVCLESALALIEKNGSCAPILFELRPDGTVQSVALLDMRARQAASDMVEGFIETLQLRAAAGAIAGCAIGVDVPHGDGRAIKVMLRTAESAQDRICPYTVDRVGLLRRRRIVSRGAITTQSVANNVFIET